MSKITELNFDNTYLKLPEEFYQKVKPTPFENPHLVSFNPDAAALLDLDPKEAEKLEFAGYICGKKQIPGSEPIAMYYTGHQFGVYNPHIGDGRAILLGEVRNQDGKKWDLHLKGAGRTRYSRQFDGRAVLRSVIREYLCSEAMHTLGIPTTRALCIVGSDEKVEREAVETGAMMVRIAESHVRFGSFEAFHYTGNQEYVKLLADYVIGHHFPHIRGQKQKYGLLLEEITQSTAELIAMWQAYGFVHGVMNTDNMSVVGLTIDYGPYGFMEKYQPEYTPNHSDHFGRYSFENQPAIAFWNLKKLAQSLRTLIKDTEALETVEKFRDLYREKYLSIMFNKLGLNKRMEGDGKLVLQLLETMAESTVDYTNFFRTLGNFTPEGNDGNKEIRNMFGESSLFDEWKKLYSERLRNEKSDDEFRKKAMNSVNPKYVLRNYLAEKAIERATEFSDYTEITRLHNLLKLPFDEHPEMFEYAEPAPEWARNLVISCSS